MTTRTLYTCDGCRTQSQTEAEFNNGPGNNLIPDWTVAGRGGALAKLGERHYCRACIDALNRAINEALAARMMQANG